jgi:hypothetical protein
MTIVMELEFWLMKKGVENEVRDPEVWLGVSFSGFWISWLIFSSIRAGDC